MPLVMCKTWYLHDFGGEAVMNIESEIFDFYIKNGHIDTYKGNWLFRHLEELSSGMNAFEEPSYSLTEIQTMKKIAVEIRKEIDYFEPNNIEVWNLLFPDWEESISNVVVHLMVGLPKGYDALALQDENGRPLIIYDIGNWLAYQEHVISDVTNNLLTHELGHICIQAAFPDIVSTYLSGTYLEGLDAITFNEGFAHLLAFENRNISLVDWHHEKFNCVYTDASEKMKAALLEKNPSKQKKYIQESMVGSYYGKFGAMVGMLYLAGLWLRNGNLGLKNAFDEGYLGFASKAIKNG